MTTTKPFQLGSISTGTLKTEDLLQRFAEELSNRGGDATYHTLIADAFMAVCEEGFDDCQILHHLEVALQTLCPLFVDFGAHPNVPCAECKGIKGDRAGICQTCRGTGEGADFGFWPDWDAINNELSPHSTNTLPDEPWEHYTGDVILLLPRRYLVVGKTIVVMDLDRNILWSTV